MRRFAAFLFAIFVLFAASARAEPQPGKPPIPLRGILYRVDYRGHTCYLFGTVHVGQSAFYPLEPRVMRALHDADTLAIEVDVRDAAALRRAAQTYGFYPEGDTIDRHLPPGELAHLKQALRHAGIPFENVARMKPWMVANLLLVQAMARHGFPPGQGIEEYFLAVAQKEGKAVTGLETAGYQLSLFDRLDDAQQRAYLHETLRNLASGKEVREGLALIDAWQHADDAAMQSAMRDTLSDGPSDRLIEKLLLAQRNPAMAAKIGALIRRDRDCFVAIGALHLLGRDGVPALLAAQGYRVRKLY